MAFMSYTIAVFMVAGALVAQYYRMGLVIVTVLALLNEVVFRKLEKFRGIKKAKKIPFDQTHTALVRITS